MSGAKRRTGYRKAVTTEVLDSFPEPVGSECVARITGTRGGSTFELETADGIISTCQLPSKFKNVIWIKRGDYVIVAYEDSVKGGGVDFPSGPLSRSYTVSHVLYKEQIKHLKARGLWPFPDTEAAAAAVYDPFAGIDDERSDEEEVEEEEEGGDAPG